VKATYSAIHQEPANPPNRAISNDELVNLPINLILERLNTSQQGLSQEEAASRLEIFGYNEFTQKKKKTVIFELLHHLSNPLLIILLIAGLISGILGETINTAIIFSIVIISIGLNLFQ
jgi:magnesium-transporting ATPase (P-type)